MKYSEPCIARTDDTDTGLAIDLVNYRAKDDGQSSVNPVNASSSADEFDNIDIAYTIGMELLEKHLSVITLDANLRPPSVHKEYLSSSFRMNEKLLRWSLQHYPNLGVFTGKMSMNLFVLRAQSLRSIQALEGNFSEKLKWVSRCGNTYYAWFLCWDGVVANSFDRYDVDVLGDKQIVVVPGSKLPRGSWAEWVIHDGAFPPIIDQSDFDQSPLKSIRIKKVGAADAQELITTYFYAGSAQTKRSAIDKLILFSELQNFGNGTSGVNKKLLFKALIKRAIIETPKDFRATPRELEQMTPISRKSIMKYLNEFCKMGLIAEKSCGPLGKRFSFKLPGRISARVCNNRQEITVSEVLNHDCWSSRGLGTSGKAILELLQKKTTDQHLNIITVAELTGLSRVTVSQKLKQLERFDLVYCLDRSWWVNKSSLTLEKLNDISRELGVNGFFQKRKEGSDNERREYLIGKAIYGNSRSSPVNNRPSL